MTAARARYRVMQLHLDSDSGTPSTGTATTGGPSGESAIRPSQIIKTAMIKPRSHSYFSMLDGLLRTFSPGSACFFTFFQ